MSLSVDKFKQKNQARYKRRSKECGRSAKCPYAFVTLCPNFFQSKRLLLQTCYATSKNQKITAEKIEKKWREAGFWYTEFDDEPYAERYVCKIENFCPEVAFNHPDPLIRGIYASKITEYDESPRIVDNPEELRNFKRRLKDNPNARLPQGIELEPLIDEVRRKLTETEVPPDDWRWYYEEVKEMHYTECQFYSRLRAIPASISLDTAEESALDDANKIEDVSVDEEDNEPIFEHFEKFTKIMYKGEQIDLMQPQARAVEMLYNASKRNNPWVHQSSIVQALPTDANRLRDVFKSRLKEVWNTLIISDKHGNFKLDI